MGERSTVQRSAGTQPGQYGSGWRNIWGSHVTVGVREHLTTEYYTFVAAWLRLAGFETRSWTAAFLRHPLALFLVGTAGDV